MQHSLFDVGMPEPRQVARLRWPCILLDPPWIAEAGGGGRGAQNHYPLMSTAELMRLPIDRVAAESGHLWLWATDSTDEDARRCLDAWGGWRRVASWPWVKMKDGRLQLGLGQYSRKCHEVLILAVRGDAMVPPPARRPPSVIIAPRTVHSRKPDESYAVIEAVSSGPRLELFARRARSGWWVLGNQAPGAGGDIAADLWALVDGRMPLRAVG